jgi:hypothetical protein
MMRLNNFIQYVPEYTLESLASAIYLQAETGEDWYYYRDKFSPDTIKICFDATGVICAFSQDATTLWPVNMSVVEFDAVPDGLANDGRWLFDGEAIQENPDYYVRIASIRRKKGIAAATEEIEPLKDAVEKALASTAEAERLEALKLYRLALYRIDPQKGEAIEWPEAP